MQRGQLGVQPHLGGGAGGVHALFGAGGTAAPGLGNMSKITGKLSSRMLLLRHPEKRKINQQPATSNQQPATSNQQLAEDICID
ncbi:hypothetical protein [Streptomyces sp. NPDC005760]|uniref:hypothetical protein n=1 Tax=Streptomyces sp. NPDC005760 TaxID=3156718 RepID=UPI0033ED8A37